ncbi:hypothetical protein [Bifidobacterium leontopitheci]|nr:hypothetical protein [Bifidobacterium leontopitheci]
MKKGLAALLGLAMMGTIGAGVTSVANAADLPVCQVNNTQWIGSNADTNLKKCLSDYAAGKTNAIDLVADVDFGGFTYDSYSIANGPLTINGNGHTISHIHFVVTKGASLTLSNVTINDNANGEDWGKAQIPVFVGGDDADHKSSFTLTGGASLNSNQGTDCAFGIVVGNYANVTIDSNGTGADKGKTIYGSDAAIVTKNNSDKHIGNGQSQCNVPQAEQVTGSTITINNGNVEAENSDSLDNSYAVNSWGADVKVKGGTMPEAYVRGASYVQNGGILSYGVDNSDIDTTKYPLTLENAQAYISGGTLVNNPAANGNAPIKTVGQSTVNVLPGKNGIVLGSKTFTADGGFATPVQDEHGAGFSSKYFAEGSPIDFNPTANPYTNVKLYAVPAQTGEDTSTSFDAESLATRSGAEELAENDFNGDVAYGAYSPIHAAQYVYARWAASAQSYIAGDSNTVYLYGDPLYVASYTYYDGTKQNPTEDSSFPKATNAGLFAGWYSDNTLKTSISKFPSSPKYPFGYFVGEKTQNVLVQRSASMKGKFYIRVLSSLPNLHFGGASFEVSFFRQDGTQDGRTLTLNASAYSRADVKGRDNGLFGVKDSGFDMGDGQYWAVAFVSNIPDSFASDTVKVTPSWKTNDGTDVSRGALSGVLAVPDAAKQL